MSVTEAAFLTTLRDLLQPLPLPQQVHTIHRLYEKLRVIHNAVGDVYQHRATVQEFADQYPTVYAVIAPELKPYVDGDYLTEVGWQLFLTQMFDPRHWAIMQCMLTARYRMRQELADYELEPIT